MEQGSGNWKRPCVLGGKEINVIVRFEKKGGGRREVKNCTTALTDVPVQMFGGDVCTL